MSISGKDPCAGRLVEEFGARFGGVPRLFRAPARVNLIGEHVDYNDGRVLTTCISLYSRVAIAARATPGIGVYSCRFGEHVEIPAGHAVSRGNGHWSDYVAGVAACLRDEGIPLPDANLLIDGDIPLGGGLSSSASLEVATALALLALSSHSLARPQVALLCQRAENEHVGVRCGIMDQYSIACGGGGGAMLLDCAGLSHLPIALPGDVRILVVHSGVHHRLQQGEYNALRDDCAEGLAAIRRRWPQLQSLGSATPGQVDAVRGDVPDRVYRRCRHVVREIDRVGSAVEALEGEEMASFGRLVTQCHASLRDDFAVSCTEIDVLVEAALSCPGVLGARMFGAGFGGCILALLRADIAEAVTGAVLERATRALGTRPWHVLAQPAAAAGELDLRGYAGERVVHA